MIQYDVISSNLIEYCGAFESSTAAIIAIMVITNY